MAGRLRIKSQSKSRTQRPARHLNSGLAVGLLALFVALGGVAMAGGANHSASRTDSARLIYKSEEAQVGPNSVNGALVLCGRRTHVVGGGVSGPGANSDVWVVASQPVDSGDKGDAPDDAWYGFVDNQGTQTHEISVYAICARGIAVSP